MVKFLLLLIVCFSFSFSFNAQTYGNEWINYNQKYYACFFFQVKQITSYQQPELVCIYFDWFRIEHVISMN